MTAHRIRPLRVVRLGMRTHLLNASRDPLWITFTLITPVVYAFLAVYLFRAGQHPERIIDASVGAGLMGIWTAVLFDSGTAIQNMRWRGTLESVVIAPVPLALALFPITLASAVLGIYSMAATVLCALVFFGASLPVGATVPFLLGLVVCTLAMGTMGMLSASLFVLMRNPNALMNTLDHPVWLLSGMLVPIALLPGWLHPVSWALPSTWGSRALYGSMAHGPVARPTALAVASGAVYLALAVTALRHVEHRARVDATLPLA